MRLAGLSVFRVFQGASDRVGGIRFVVVALLVLVVDRLGQRRIRSRFMPTRKCRSSVTRRSPSSSESPFSRARSSSPSLT